MPMASKRFREHLALLGGTALLALAILGAITRRALSRRRPARQGETMPRAEPPGGIVPP